MPTLKTNLLYFGDNLPILRENIPDESIDLVYLDPPFNSNRNYFVFLKDRTGQASAAQEEAFADTWTWTEESERTYHHLILETSSEGLATLMEALRKVLRETAMMAYLVAMAARLVELHRVLKPTGSLYLHCDPTASHYLKIILDTVFGPRNFSNHITWQRSDTHNDAKKQFPAISDHILLYRKTDKATFNKQFVAHAEKTLIDWYQYVESSDGVVRKMTKEEKTTQKIPMGCRRFNADNMASPNPRPNLMYVYKGYPHPEKGWRYSRETMEELDAAGLLLFPENPAGRIMRKRYLDEQSGSVMGDVWSDVSQIRASMPEGLGYPTQKPLALLRRIIQASSNPGDVVLDPFCGCGTTVTAAQELGRKWIGIDITAVATAVIKTRLEQMFPEELKGKIVIEGMPKDFESARQLFESDPYKFQAWACTLIDAYPLTKKGADSGIDGWLNFLDWAKKRGNLCPAAPWSR